MKNKIKSGLGFFVLVCLIGLCPMRAQAQFGEIIIGDLVVDFFVEEGEDLLKEYGEDLLKDLLKDIVSGLFTDTSAGITADGTGLYVLTGDGIHYDLAYLPVDTDGALLTNSTGRTVITNALGSEGEALSYDSVNGWVLGTKSGIDDEVRVFKASDLRNGDQDPDTHLYTGIGSFDHGIDTRNGISYIATSDKIWIGRFYKQDGDYEKDKYKKYDVPGNPNDVAVDDTGILFITTTYESQDWLLEYSTGTDGQSPVELTRWVLGDSGHFWGVATDGQLVYVVNQHDNQLEVFDYDGQRVLNAQFPTNSISPYYVEVVGNYAYVTDASDQGDTEQIIHTMQIDPSVRRSVASTGLETTRSRRVTHMGLPPDAETTLTADIAAAVMGNQLELNVQFKESHDLLTWSNFGERITITNSIPSNYPSLFYCITSGQVDE